MPGNWQPIARREFRTTVKSRFVWILLIPIVLDGLLNVITSQTAIQHLGNLRYIASFQRGIGIITPIACIILGAKTVGGARGEGYLKYTAIQPVSRIGLLLGKVVGRASGLIVPLSAGVFLGYLHGVVGANAPPLLPTVGFWLASVLYVGTLMLAMVGLSATFKNALAPSGLAFILGGGMFLFYDNLLPILLKSIYGVEEVSSGTSFAVSSVHSSAPLTVSAFLTRLLPTNAYYTLTNWTLGLPNTDSLSIFVIYQLTPQVTALDVVLLENAFESQPVPVYLHPLMSGAVLVFFSTFVFVLGYYTFNNTDFNQ
ncbi:hypothetical protein C440_06172 [Haloferax mucosum ATCC BAA-1512]|uniref:ABC transporter permease n=1 Tax=Haloferax mucosum ATCC BAA-1512 TaxID=662479 RepID=M0IJ08_9EURY|nr:ABC transporter permease subunit [Haloferax mucosum]ELZ95853.1 hypothetical protein C440_06172 [Haloferax mucosum ATCC BAA-1512]